MGRRRAYLLVVLGCCLLANGLYADRIVPEGEYRFEATPVGEDPDERVAALADAGALVSLPPAEWDPILRSASRADGTYRAAAGDLPPPADRLLTDGVRYASVGDRLYLVVVTEDDGTVTLSAARTTPDRALAAVAVPASGSGPYARALADGSTETRLFTPRETRLVRTDGEYSLVSVTPVSPYDGPLELLPLALYPAGYVVLLWGLLSHPSLPSNYTIAPASKG